MNTSVGNGKPEDLDSKIIASRNGKISNDEESYGEGGSSSSSEDQAIEKNSGDS